MLKPETLLALTDEPAFLLDRDGTLLDGSPAFQKHVGGQPCDGMPLDRLLSPADMGRLRKAIAAHTEEGQKFRVPGLVLPGPNSGGERIVDLLCATENNTVLVFVKPAGPAPDMPLPLHGLTDLGQTLLESIPAPVFIKNTDHIYTGCNEEFLNSIGLARQDLIGKSVHDISAPNLADTYRKADDELFAAGGRQVYESKVCFADGTVRDVLFHKSVLTDNAGATTGLIGVLLDISDLRQAERKWRQSENMLRAVIDNSPAYVFMKDMEGRYLLAGNHAGKKYGMDGDKILGKDDFEIFPDDIARQLRGHDQQVAAANRPLTFREDFRYQADEQPTLTVKFPVNGTDGEVIGVAGIATDIKELVETQERLEQISEGLEQQVLERTRELTQEIQERKNTERAFQHILDSSPVGVGIANKQCGTITFANRRLKDLIAPQAKTLLGEKAHTFWASDEDRRTFFTEISETGHLEIMNTRIIRRGSDPFPADIFGRQFNLGDTDQVVFWLYDLTQIKEAQKELEASETQLRNILAASPVSVGISEVNTGRFTFVNESLATLLGCSMEQLMTTSTLGFWVDLADRDAMIEEVSETGQVMAREVHLTRFDGSPFWALNSWVKIMIDGREKIVSWLTDISPIKEAELLLKETNDRLEIRVAERTRELEKEIADRRKIEAALRESEANFKASALSTSDWFWAMDENLRFTSVSDRFQKLAGIQPETFLGKERWDNSGVDQSSADWEQHKRDLTNRKPFRDFRFQLHKTDGSLLHISISGVPIFDDQGQFRGYRGAGRDISGLIEAKERSRKMEQQLRQAQKMEAVGQLTGGVAHDFNNILAVILGNVDLLQEALPEDTPVSPFIRAIERSSTRAAQLTQRLLAYSRKQSLHPQMLQLDHLTLEMLDMIDRLLGETILVRFEHTPGIWPIFADPSQIENSLLNFCINARDAMPEGGNLTIRTFNRTVSKEEALELNDVTAGEYVGLSVEDTGKGMDAATLEHVFEPFFTTKEVGKGTGLGLSMIYGFAKQSNGFVTLESEPGQGTTASIFLPRATPS
ncbi:PAS domain S-box protein [Sneathiella chinensis]|uniref:histidine kinase n=1 Tax=Sneathiella chinensis TaxID=349750 RepID=A0ABQ5U481_9PROT|nr:PAS domain S-box protein [Sneathiella chinensis]GLQ06132.1 hypothetical protein GCM10007924_13530 [Sneathiella chinensis]